MKFIPLAIGLVLTASAVQAAQLGGFQIDEVFAPLGSDYGVATRIRGSRWTGVYGDDGFHLLVKAQGKNKVWQIDSAEKSKKLLDYRKAPVRSILSLYELDCGEGRLRALAAEFHTEYFAEGKSIWRVNTPGEWLYPSPGSRADFSLFWGCGLIKK